jgi:hypothetical protein
MRFPCLLLVVSAVLSLSKAEEQQKSNGTRRTRQLKLSEAESFLHAEQLLWLGSGRHTQEDAFLSFFFFFFFFFSPTPITSVSFTDFPSIAPVANSAPTVSSSKYPTLVPIRSTDPYPGTSATEQPTNFFCDGFNRSDILLGLLQSVTSEDLLLNRSLPQGQAFLWLLDTDITTDPCIYPSVKQRYSVAVIYFALGGNNGAGWIESTGWLSSMEECDWARVNCDEKGGVTGLQLGRYSN